MKNIKRIILVLIALSVALCCISSCEKEDSGDGDNNNSQTGKYATYSVSVIDEIGKPVSNVMLKYVNSSGETKTAVSDKNGAATLKNALIGGSLKPEQGFSDAVILTSEYTLPADTTSVRVIVRDSAKAHQIYGAVEDETYAYPIGSGTHTVPATAGKTSYFIFHASSAGVYKVSFTSDDAGMTVGFYGDPMVVQPGHLGDGDYDGKSFELIIRDLSTPYVIGLNCVNTVDANVIIERVGDAPFDPTFDVPVVNVTAKGEIAPVTLPAGSVLKDFNIATQNISVVLGDDGYYYTADGKKVYLRIDSVGDYSAFMDIPFASLATIAGFEGYQMGGTSGGNIGGYIFDENGGYVEKRIYNDMLKSYWEKCDPENGVYPLNAELAEAIKVHGDNAGWWDAENQGTYIFKVPVTPETAWLFLCCTVE